MWKALGPRRTEHLKGDNSLPTWRPDGSKAHTSCLQGSGERVKYLVVWARLPVLGPCAWLVRRKLHWHLQGTLKWASQCPESLGVQPTGSYCGADPSPRVPVLRYYPGQTLVPALKMLHPAGAPGTRIQQGSLETLGLVTGGSGCIPLSHAQMCCITGTTSSAFVMELCAEDPSPCQHHRGKSDLDHRLFQAHTHTSLAQTDHATELLLRLGNMGWQRVLHGGQLRASGCCSAQRGACAQLWGHCGVQAADRSQELDARLARGDVILTVQILSDRLQDGRDDSPPDLTGSLRACSASSMVAPTGL